MRAYIDADVLIWHLRGEKKAKDLLIHLREQEQYDLYTGVMQRAEVIFFMRAEEKTETELFLSQIKTESVNQKIVDRAGALYRKWNPSTQSINNFWVKSFQFNAGILSSEAPIHRG